MRLTGSRGYAPPAPTPKMPPGLVELMEGLAKDVLKNNPENVYEFCAAHMQKLLEIRDGHAPPKKQMSLGQKIVKTQDKIRQRIKNQHHRREVNTSEQPNGNHDLEDKPPVTEFPIEKTLAIQPDVEIPDKNKADIQSVANTAVENAPVIQPVVHGEKTLMANEVEVFHEPDVIITTNDTSVDEASNPAHDRVVQSIEASQVERELNEDVVVFTQEIRSDSKEKVSGMAGENVKTEAKQISDNEAIAESKNFANLNEQSKNIVDPNVDEDDNNEIQLNDSKPTVSEKINDAEEIIDNLEDESLSKTFAKDELIDVAFAPSLTHNDSVQTHIDDIKATEQNVVEEDKIAVKEELTDIQHEEILKEKYESKIESGESINVVVEQEIKPIETEETADVQPVITLAEKEDNVEFKKTIEEIKHAREEDLVKQDSNNLLSRAEDLTIGELTVTQVETPNLAATVSDENLIVHAIDNEIPEISNSQASEIDVELKDTHVIKVDMTEKPNQDDSLKNDDGLKNQLYYGQEVDKELHDVNDKHAEEPLTYCDELIAKDSTEGIHDNTMTLNRNSTIIENDETPENAAVSAMDLETAAITIQKVFRTFLFSKSRTSTLDYTVNENSLDEDIENKDEAEYILTSSTLNKERRTLGISRMDTVLQTVNEEKSLSLSDDSSLSSAATTIQAHVRGFLVRNKLASNKTASSSSLVNSDGPSEGDVNEPKKTILNIHIVPERGQFMSRDESLLTSIDLPLDNSPPSSINLHPMGYDKSAERRKQLKREDAVQSISPPSNNSGKLSEEIDTVKDVVNNSVDVDVKEEHESISVNDHDKPQDADTESCDTTLTISSTAETVLDADTSNPREVLSSPDHNLGAENKIYEVIISSSSDEMDVVTPYSTIPEKTAKVDSGESEHDEKLKLVHSGEFHDMVVQTQVKRSESSVVREFKNVLVYFLLWDKT